MVSNYNNILIAGFGKEGKSTYKYLRQLNDKLKITIADKNVGLENYIDNLNDTHTKQQLGINYLNNLDEFDLIIRSPGINKNIFKNVKGRLSSQVELFIEKYRNQIIGITGTKGKSTSVSIMYSILKQSTNDVILAGNIGTPTFSILESITPNSLIILELSCHQLHGLKVSPKYAIIINLFPEHLDYYSNTTEYYLAKLNILLHQKQADIAVVNNDNESIRELLSRTNHLGKLIKCSIDKETQSNQTIHFVKDHFTSIEDESYAVDVNNMEYLNTQHMIENLTLILNMAYELGVGAQEIHKGLISFQALEHRAEFFGEYNGIKFINDSISTIPESTIAAINSLANISTIILGGKNRGINYQILIDEVEKSNIENVICMEETGQSIYNQLANLGTDKNIYFLEELSEIVNLAFDLTNKESYCLFSPGASSYDRYKNFEERGSLFKTLVRSYSGNDFRNDN